MDPFKELINMRDEYEKKIKEFGREKIQAVFEAFFKEHPLVEQVYWDQYAPYFNDGEPCVFSVNMGNILVTKKFALDNPTIVKGYNEEEEEEEGWGAMQPGDSYPDGPRWMACWQCHQDKSEQDIRMGLTLAQAALSKLLELEDVWKSVFGDSIGILITRTEEGVEIQTESIDHD